MSYVGPTTYGFSTVRNFNVPSTARPAAPSVLYIVPIYQRATTSSGVTRTGGALRVYLDRPWWSSGDGELLGVVCCPPATLEADGDVPTALAPFVTQWGFDPVFSSTTSMPAQPNPGNFPLRLTGTFDSTPLPVEGTPYEVNVAGHEVGFDSTRGLWFCDVQLLNDGVELPSYMPFVRLALARFQPNSLEDAYLSKIVLTDWAQLAPDRSVTVTQTGVQGRRVLFSVTVAGRAATATAASAGPSLMTVTVEQMDTRITDDALAWRRSLTCRCSTWPLPSTAATTSPGRGRCSCSSTRTPPPSASRSRSTSASGRAPGASGWCSPRPSSCPADGWAGALGRLAALGAAGASGWPMAARRLRRPAQACPHLGRTVDISR